MVLKVNTISNKYNLKKTLNIQNFAENFYLERFKIIKSCVNIFELIKMEILRISNRKFKLCGQKEFGYNFAYLFN